VSQLDIAVMNNQAKRPYSNASKSQYSIGFLARSTLEVFITAIPVTVPYIARDKGIRERAKHKSGWFRMLSCPIDGLLHHI
jgi:endonuclease YncB( thermonuclease family)